MPLPASERLRWALLVLAGGVLLLAFHGWWIAAYRDGYPFNIDEAAYTAIGLNDYLALRAGGIDAWWQAIQQQAPNAPLVPAVASLLCLVKPGTMAGFAALGAFMLLLGLATYGIAERLAGPRLGAVAALVAMSAPGTIGFTRVYIFALPAAALLACAVYALLRSDGLRRWRWALACGACLGLMLLARTMAIAFVPGVAAAGVVALLARGRDRRELGRGFLGLGLLLLATAAVAALWYWRNLQPVLDYLTDYGYGSKSAEFGAERGLFSWSRWSAVAQEIAEVDLLLPLAALTAAGLIAVLVAAGRRIGAAAERRAAAIELVRGDAAAVAIVVLAGYAALTSSRNSGFGFTLPLTVLLPPLAAIALRRFPRATVPAGAAVALIAVANLAASSSLWSDLSHDRRVDLPGLVPMPLLNGVNYALADIRKQVDGPETRFAERDRGWLRADKLLAALLLREEGPPVVAFASRSRVLNTNTVWLAGVLHFRRGIPMAQLVADDGDSTRAYVRRLSDPRYGLPGMLITMTSERGDYEPHVTQPKAEQAARRLRFRPVRTLTLPDARRLRIWTR